MRRTCEVWGLFERTHFSLATCLALAAISITAHSHAPAQTPPEPRTTISSSPSVSPTQPVARANDAVLTQGAFTIPTIGGEIKEDQLRQLLAGKTLYLRGGYQDNNLEF